MVYLNRIYTKTGDDGTTGLGDGARVPKTHPRIAACGGVDELNSFIGLALADDPQTEFADWLRKIQNDLFDLGADLCVPESDDVDPERPPLRASPAQVEQLERWIDEANACLQPLTSFVLPGGAPAAARLHVARAVCRRVEISVLHLAEYDVLNPHVLWYLNRLSDLLFVLARRANGDGRTEILWKPGSVE